VTKRRAFLSALFFVLLVLGILLISLQPWDGCFGDLKTRGRGRWVREQVTRLLAFEPGKETVAVAVAVSPNGNSVALDAWEGWVPLGSAEWVFYTSCSSHDWPADLVLAIDHTGRLYACNAHVCPKLFLTWPAGTKLPLLNSASAFFSSTADLSTGEQGSTQWVAVDGWKHRAVSSASR